MSIQEYYHIAVCVLAVTNLAFFIYLAFMLYMSDRRNMRQEDLILKLHGSLLLVHSNDAAKIKAGLNLFQTQQPAQVKPEPEEEPVTENRGLKMRVTT